ncbi:cytidine deaminase [Balneola vulgaris]|uniref:cytidine deaminase n=1 Tax=Balneola vulgaris TaxID=287535 RepID=UPI00037DA42F|nr:cytidine deaminase [Balneola vulgaris]
MTWNQLFERAFIPYSKNANACIIQGASGKNYVGVRVENLSFPLTVSAIQAACCFCLASNDEPKVLITHGKPLEQQSFWVTEFDLEIKIVDDLTNIELFDDIVSELAQEVSYTLKGLLSNAKTMHSDFPVSSLIKTENGWISGVNIEVSDWSRGLCAERVAISKAFALGYTQFKEIYVHTLKGEVSSPCGACRQVIHQHMAKKSIHMYHADDTISTHAISDLLPFNFTSNTLSS